MKSALIGTRAPSHSSRPSSDSARSGFTLIEALVALALILAFVAVITPYLFQSRRIMADAEGRLAAQIVLRSILTAPVDRKNLAAMPLRGEIQGIRWQLSAEPMEVPAMIRRPLDPPADNRDEAQAAWSAFRITARAWWGPNLLVSAETMRLGKGEQE